MRHIKLRFVCNIDKTQEVTTALKTLKNMSLSPKRDLFFFALILLSIVVVLWQKFGMMYSLQIFPAPMGKPAMFNDERLGGHSIAELSVTEDKIQLDCETKPSEHTFPFCSVQIPMTVDERGVDLSKFDYLDIELGFEGSDKDTVLLYLINEEPHPNGIGKILRNNLKTVFPIKNFDAYRIPITEFYLPSWWIFNHAELPISFESQMNNIMLLQVTTGDNRQPRKESIYVTKATLNGKWISERQTYLGILVVWGTLVSLYFVTRMATLLKMTKAAKQRENQLISLNKLLQIEKDKFESLSKIDPLTQIYNRAGIREKLGEIVTDFNMKKEVSSLITFDIDHFKNLNDSYGHDVGDTVLKNLAGLISNSIRKRDVFARWGGEEFVIICPETSVEVAAKVADNLRKKIANAELITQQTVTCSFGVAELRTSNVTQWFKISDEKLYEAKKTGRNKVCY